MAKITLTYDSETKDSNLTINGKTIKGLSSLTFQKYKDSRGETASMSVCIYKDSDDDSVHEVTYVSASKKEDSQNDLNDIVEEIAEYNKNLSEKCASLFGV